MSETFIEWTVIGHPAWPGCAPVYRNRADSERMLADSPHPDAYLVSRVRSDWKRVLPTKNPYLPERPEDGKHRHDDGSYRCLLCGAYAGSPEDEGPCRGEFAESSKMRSAAATWLARDLADGPCQVAVGERGLTCPEHESGGLRCEVQGPHDLHVVSRHTVAHALAGNGYHCDSIRGARTV